jgi:hypothetical protein
VSSFPPSASFQLLPLPTHELSYALHVPSLPGTDSHPFVALESASVSVSVSVGVLLSGRSRLVFFFFFGLYKKTRQSRDGSAIDRNRFGGIKAEIG